MQVLVKAFEAGEDAGECVVLPGSFAGGVGGAAPEVDSQIAVNPNRDRGTDLVAFDEVVFEGVADPLKAGAQEPLTVTRGWSFTGLPTTTPLLGMKGRSYCGAPMRNAVSGRESIAVALRLGCGSTSFDACIFKQAARPSIRQLERATGIEPA